MKILARLFAIAWLGASPIAHAAETSPLQFVTEYVRQLGAMDRIRVSATEDNLKVGGSVLDRLVNCIRSGTSYQLELRSQIAMMTSMPLSGLFEELPKNIAEIYRSKLEAYEEAVNVCSSMLEGPKPNVDFQAMAAKAAAKMPKITAQMDYLDNRLFKLAPVVAATLIDMKPDSQNHVSHLIITRAERQWLLREIQLEFGASLQQDKQPWLVSSASVIRDILKDHKCSDDPW